MKATGTAPDFTAADREKIREMLDKRYDGMIPITEEIIDAVLDGLREEGQS
jgi:siroheme synthase (precorrin-2 oxidase/ferrochelatase)